MIKSPCTKVCKIEDGVCIGCQRTLEQIKNWSKYTDRARDEIMDDMTPSAHNSKINSDSNMQSRKVTFTIDFFGIKNKFAVSYADAEDQEAVDKLIDKNFDEIQEWRKLMTKIKYI